MHEMALAEGILAVVLDVAGEEPVRRVRLRVGKLQHVVPDSLQFCFQLAAQDTPAAEAMLELEEVPARLRCRRCGVESAYEAPPPLCQHCGAVEIDFLTGEEVLVDAIELDSGWQHRPESQGSEPVAVEIPADHLEEHLADAHRHAAERSS